MARRRPPTVHGVAVVDKPAGVTSHDVVAMLRKRLGERRVGHAGTLDPDATGVLVVGVGHATKLLRFITDGAKRYRGDVVLGAATDTLDASGSVVAEAPVGDVDAATVRSVIAERFTGEVAQVPPMVSALKVDGRRLHELAREGIEIERPPRLVMIHSCEVVAIDGNVITIDVHCSAGTYIRSLAADLGEALGTVAHLTNLRRTAVEPFTIDQAASPDECELLPIEAAVGNLTRLVAPGPLADRVRQGALLPAPDGAGPWAMFDDDDALLAVYERFHDETMKPSTVIPTTPTPPTHR